MTYEDEHGEPHAISWKRPRTQDDWHKKRAANDAVFEDIGGLVFGNLPLSPVHY